LIQNVAIFASGSGSNAEKIIEHFSTNDQLQVKLILTNKSDAFVIERANKFSIESVVFNRDDFYKSSTILDKLISNKIDWVVLAGFLWLVPDNLIERYPKKIINIHPALLPKYGGKGMYGKHVHQAVFDNFEKETGITIHYVNPKYDDGQIIFQTSVKLEITDTPDKIAEKIHMLEHKHFPAVLENLFLES